MKVLISGAGITGNTLAFWLSKLGHDVTVIERFAELRTSGLQIDLRAQAIDVVKHMGIEPDIRTKSVPEQGLLIVDKSGKQRGYFPANKSGKGLQNFTSDYEIMRGDLCRVLCDAAVTKGANFVFGTSIEHFEEKDSSIHVRFADGKTDTYDLLVGADGQWSRTRRMMLGSEKPDAFYPIGGMYVAYFTIPRPIKEGEQYICTLFIGTRGRGVMTRRHNPDKLQVYIGGNVNSERLKNTRRGDVEEEKAALTELMKGAGWKVDEYLDVLPDAHDFYCERLGLVKLDSWSNGCVAVVGDAAYSPSANTGMGTSSGIVGAYVLAGEIAKHCGGTVGRNGLSTALKAYEQTFRPFVTLVQKGVMEDEGGLPSSRFGIAVFNWLAGMASLFKVNPTRWFLKEDSVKGWKLPEYEELLRD